MDNTVIPLWYAKSHIKEEGGVFTNIFIIIIIGLIVLIYYIMLW